MSHELRIGLMAAICIAITVWGYKFMKGKNILNASNYYYVKYQNVDQLASSSPVLIYGLKVGSVASVELGDDMESIIATLDIDKGIRFPKDTRAVIISTSLMGGKAVVLEYDEPCSNADCAEKGDSLAGDTRSFFNTVVSDKDIKQLKKGVGEVFGVVTDSLTMPGSESAFADLYRDLQLTLNNMASITSQLNTSLASYDRNMDATLKNLNTISTAIAENSSSITSTIQNLDSLTSALIEQDVLGQASTVLTSTDQAVKRFEATLEDASHSFDKLREMIDKVHAGKGTLGLLARDEALYNNLNASVKNLDLLLQDFRLNPKRYVNVSVFGKKQKEYTPPEENPAFEDHDQ